MNVLAANLFGCINFRQTVRKFRVRNLTMMTNSQKEEPTGIFACACCQSTYGLWLGAIARFFWTLTCTVSKYIRRMGAIQYCLYIRIGSMIVHVIFATMWRGMSIKEVFYHPKARIYFPFVGMISGIVIPCFFYAVNNMDLGDAAAIEFSNPLCISVVAYFWIREKTSLVEFLLMMLIMLGVMFNTRPAFMFGSNAAPPPSDALISIWISNISWGILVVLWRLMYEKAPTLNPLTNLTYVFLGQVVVCAIVMFAWHLPFVALTGMEWVWLGVGIITGYLAQWLATESVKYERAGPAFAMRAVDVVFYFIAQEVVFGGAEDNITFSLIGAAIIVLASLSIGWYKMKYGEDTTAGKKSTIDECQAGERASTDEGSYFLNGSKDADEQTPLIPGLGTKVAKYSETTVHIGESGCGVSNRS